MEKQKQKTERDNLIERILNARREMNLPTDEHMINFINSALDEEIKEVWEGLEELIKIFRATGSRTFASERMLLD